MHDDDETKRSCGVAKKNVMKFTIPWRLLRHEVGSYRFLKCYAAARSHPTRPIVRV